MTTTPGGGRARPAERRSGGGREAVQTGSHEQRRGIRGPGDCAARGRRRGGAADRQSAAALRAIVAPRTYADPRLGSSRRDTDLPAAEAPAASIAAGCATEVLPGARAMREILDRMNDRLERIRTGTPLQATEATEAIGADVERVRDRVRHEAEAPEIARDAAAEVAPGAYVRGGKNPDRGRG